MTRKKLTLLVSTVFFLITNIMFVSACQDFLIPEKKTESRVSVTVPPSGADLFGGVEVFLENELLPLYNVKVNNNRRWDAAAGRRTDTGAGYFSLDGKVKVKLKTNYNISSCTVRPLSARIQTTCANGQAEFTLSSGGNYTVELNGDAETAFFLFVSAFSPSSQTQGRTIRFKRGLHTSDNNEFISADNIVRLDSDTTVVLDEGAVVAARFEAYNKENITIRGNGIIDGSRFARNASTGEVTVPLDFGFCKNVTLKDFSVLDSAGWCVNFYFNESCEINGLKIITSRSNGDGISLQSCKNIGVKNCFLRTWDDSLVVKNYPLWQDKNIEGSTENITFENCVIWTDLAQSMEIGYETVGRTMKNITFKNITVLRNFHKPVISIHNGNNAEIENVLYENITVENADMGKGDAGNNCQLIEISTEFSGTWSSQHKTTPLGSIEGVTVRNLTVLAGNAVLPIRLAGCLDAREGFNNTSHLIKDVRLENVWIKGRRITASYSYLAVNKYASATVTEGETEYTETFLFDKTEKELQAYTDNAKVTLLR